MSYWRWLFRSRKPPQIFLGDVQMHLDWNLVSSFCHYFGTPVHAEPDPADLRRYFATALDLPVYDPNDDATSGGHLFHLAITDLRYGFFASLNANGYWLPLFIRPSVTVYGYLVDIDTGQVLAEERVTRKPGWIRFGNPVLFAWSWFTGELHPSPVRPMTDDAATRALLQLKKLKARNARTGHLLPKNT